MRTLSFLASVMTAGLLLLAAAAPSFAQAPSYSACENLSEQRGSGPTSGRRDHDAFMRDCLEGKTPPLTVRGVREPGDLPSRLYESCERLAEERAIMEVNAHYKFIDDCMVGRVR